jgi:hypothetical protein
MRFNFQTAQQGGTIFFILPESSCLQREKTAFSADAVWPCLGTLGLLGIGRQVCTGTGSLVLVLVLVHNTAMVLVLAASTDTSTGTS